jgi:hypothetical protein
MSRWMMLAADGGFSWRSNCCFDPGTMMLASMGATAAAGALSASGTIAGGNAAVAAGQMQQTADKFQADQLRANEGGEIGAAQRKMFDTQQTTRLANSQVQARAAASGVNAATGSPLATVKSNASRGSYQAMMDLFQGENRATASENQARGADYSGEMALAGGKMQQDASRIAALGTIAGAGSSMLKTYGAFKYPALYGRTGFG